MKNSKAGLLALALTVGVAGAFTTKAHNDKLANSGKKIIYNWAPCDASGNPTGPVEYAGTSGGASIHFGCSGSGTFCARAYSPDGTPTNTYIKHN